MAAARSKTRGKSAENAEEYMKKNWFQMITRRNKIDQTFCYKWR